MGWSVRRRLIRLSDLRLLEEVADLGLARLTIIQTQVPDDLFEQLQSIAQQENLSVEQVVAQALVAQVAAWTEQNDLQQRSRQGSWAHFQQVLAKVPHVEPEAYDRL